MGSSSFSDKPGMRCDLELLLGQGVLIGLVDDKVKINKMRGGEISKEAADAFNRIKSHKLAFIHFLKGYKEMQLTACEDLILDAYGERLFEDGETTMEWEGESFLLRDGEIRQGAEWLYQQLLK